MIECQKKLEIGNNGIVVTYCISKPGHLGKCVPDPFLVRRYTVPQPIPFVPTVFREAK
jgi:hypothetical protein